MGTQMNSWDNTANYKKCKKKGYEVYVCAPPAGVVVINKLEQPVAVAMMGGKTYFTRSDQMRMYRGNPAQYKQLEHLCQTGGAYVVGEKTPLVISGTVGELWCVDWNKLTRTYSMLNGAPIQPTTNEFDWRKVKTRPDGMEYFACHVPFTQKGKIQTAWGAVLELNSCAGCPEFEKIKQGVKKSCQSCKLHGKGDFVVATNPNDRWVVNGNIFATTYNTQGWTNEVAKNANGGNIPVPKTLLD